jgi:MscS family membrane protein
MDKLSNLLPQHILDILKLEFLGNSIMIWASAFFIFVFFVFFSKGVTRLIISPTRRLVAKSKTKLDDKFLDVIEKPLRIVVIIGGYYLAAMILTSNDTIEMFFTRIMRSAIIFLVAVVVFRAITVYSDTFTTKASRINSGLGEAITKLVLKILKFVVAIVTIISISNVWGFNAYAVLASFSIVGAGVALSSQDTIKHFWGSMVIFGDQPFKIGDWITVGSVDGVVEEIGIRSTKVRTFEKTIYTVPNGTLANANILNWSQRPKRRIKMTIGLTYDTSRDQMRAILSDIRTYLKNNKDIHQEQILVYFSEFNDSSLDIMVYCFTKDTAWDKWLEVREEVYLEFMNIVEKNGSSFAFPSQSLYVESMPKELESQ